jgi:hypothetical protein
MLWPFFCIDNFFDNPDEIVEYAKSLPYAPCHNPGTRTVSLNELDEEFFFWINKKILSVLYPMNYNELAYNATTLFAKVPPNLVHDGWVHEDSCEFSSIIYLSKQTDCGTSIFSPKKSHLKKYQNQDRKAEYFVDESKTDGLADLKKTNNENFEESIIVKPKYNRLIIFDGKMPHAAQPYMSADTTEDRLTLNSFFNSITNTSGTLKYHGAEMRRV